MQFPQLFSSLKIGGLEVRNRIVLTGHDTNLAVRNLPGEALCAYYQARAKGGAGLIVIQVVGVHETARDSDHLLMATDDGCVPAFTSLFDALHAEGARVVVQLFHPGRELVSRHDGILQPSFAPSFAPSERFRNVPAELDRDTIAEIIAGYGSAACRMALAGADGVEIVASHGYLPAQFASTHVNRRKDEYGGSLENRLRFAREAIEASRLAMPADRVVGIRLSLDECDLGEMDEKGSREICLGLAPDVDYLSLVAGTSATPAGAIHIVPPMSHRSGYLAKGARDIRLSTGKPTMVTGRINQPHEAEQIIAEGAADMCGMTRAMICDPDMPDKAQKGDVEDIRACIGCNQACIGHYQSGLPISCIQNPQTGRELTFGDLRPATRRKKVMIVGGGVAGMKAAATAAHRGHEVTLFEAGARLGGQALLAQMLEGRAEFGGIITNLERELALSGAKVLKNVKATQKTVAVDAPDVLIVATGSEPSWLELEDSGGHIVQAVDVLNGRAKAGGRIVVYDWRADWTGVGVAEKLASQGVHVRIAVNGPCAGAGLQSYLRDEAVARLFRLGIETIPFVRLFGADGDSAYFVHTTAQEPVVLDDVDTVVLNVANRPVPLSDDGGGRYMGETFVIGDALSPRTAEEAVYEGFKIGLEL